MALRMAWLVVLLALSAHQGVTGFAVPRALHSVHGFTVRAASELQTPSSTSILSSPNDDWGLGDAGQDDDPRLEAMRSMLESSWDDATMGVVPSDSAKAAEAAAESIADAMAQSKNVMMIDLRLPSYDITEGPKMYDAAAAYDFCSCLSDNLRERQLIRKSLVLVRDEKERSEIERVISQRDGESMSNIRDDDAGAAAWEDAEESMGGDVDDFRKQLMSSWDSTSDDDSGIAAPAPSPAPKKQAPQNSNSSNRLWSVLGGETISNGPDAFNQAIAAADENAILADGEDALIVLAPYATADVIALRRIMARYGQTRTIIIVNSRIESLPKELDPAVLVYGVLPLVARSKGSDGKEAGLKAVVMKRFPTDWAVYVDIGDGFKEAPMSQQVVDSSGKLFPPPEWITKTIQSYVERLPKQ
ncbi:hypothetical protein ACHAXT_000985 [Thalassiosira profunda]